MTLSPGPAPTGGAGGFHARRLTAFDGLRLYWRDYGDPLSAGRPLLCLPGLARNSKDFHDLALRHAARRRVVTLDYRGRGRSDYDRDWRNYRPEVYLRDVQALLVAAGLHGVVVCGTSMGGLLAAGLAVAAPTLLAGVIMNDIGPEIGGSGLDAIVGYLADPQPQQDLDSAAAHLRRLMPNLGFEGDAKWRALAQATYRVGEDGRLYPDWDTAIARSLARQRGDLPDLWPLFGALRRLPTLVVRGGRSDILAAETLHRMAAVKPDLQHVTVPGIGHAPSLDEPEAAAAIDSFLAARDRDG